MSEDSRRAGFDFLADASGYYKFTTCPRTYALATRCVSEAFESGMKRWWTANAENREPSPKKDPAAFGLDLDAVRPLFADYVARASRWVR